MAGIRRDKQSGRLLRRCYINGHVCPQKPAFAALSERIGGGILRMYRLRSGGAKMQFVIPAGLALLMLAAWWLSFRGSPPGPARDFEECVEQVEAKAPSNDERNALMTDCNARFAGRRKPGGGYKYYDFMQDRNFDIAGPNPTAQERKAIDRAYMGFLDVQRREAVLAELARRQIELLQADLEGARQPVGPPLVLTPKNAPPSAAKRPVDRSKSPHCEDGSLTCSWSRFSAGVKNTFASPPKTKP